MKKAFLLAILSVFGFAGVSQAEDGQPPYRRTLDIGKIVITAAKIEQRYEDLPVNVNIVEGSSIQDSGAGEISAVLDKLPALNIINYGSDGATKTAHARGLSGAQVLTLVDGIPVNSPRDGVADFNKIDLTNIERIEILRGPASSIYGSGAMGGVINIITNDGKTFPRTMLKSLYGLNDTRGIYFAHGRDLKLFDYYLSHDTYKTNGHRENSDYEYHNSNLKLGVTPKADNRLIFNYGYYTAEVGTPGKNIAPQLEDRQETRRENFDLTWKADLTQGSDVLFKAYHNIDRLEFIDNLARDDVDTHQTQVSGLDLQFAQKVLEAIRLTAGYNRQNYTLDSSTSGKHDYFLNAFYVESEISPLERLKLYFGGRYDNYSNFGGRISPSSRFSWWLNDNFKLHGLYGRSFRAPTFNDLYWPRTVYPAAWGGGGEEGNTKLSPEKAESYECGVSTYFFKVFWTDLTYFRNDAKDMIVWNVDNAGWWRPENISSALTQGLEANCDFMITERLKANFNYTLLYAKDKETKKWLIYRPRHKYNFNFNYQTKGGWTFDWSSRYVTKRFVVNDNSRSLDHYWTADAAISRSFGQKWQWQISARNLFDQDYEEAEGYPMPGTEVLTSLKYEF